MMRTSDGEEDDQDQLLLLHDGEDDVGEEDIMEREDGCGGAENAEDVAKQ